MCSKEKFGTSGIRTRLVGTKVHVSASYAMEKAVRTQKLIHEFNNHKKTPPKWQKNDLVSGGHGQAGSWRGQ